MIMSIAVVNTKKAITAKQKFMKIIDTSIRNLRNQINPKQAAGPDVFDMAKSQKAVKKNAR